MVEGVQDGLGTLANNLGIDVPDSLVKFSLTPEPSRPAPG